MVARALSLSIVLLAAWPAGASTVLPVTAVEQEHDQWCWAGVVRSALLHHGQDVAQCTLAEYTRTATNAPDLSLGQTPCCTDWRGCNSWNYFWHYTGSVADLLRHFGGLSSATSTGTLPLLRLQQDLDAGLLVVIRWEWTSGGGHFVLGHGYDGTAIHYMNPWPGEGRKIGEYDWVVRGENHAWVNSLEVCREGAACDDGDPCTEGDTCRAGRCEGRPKSCPAAGCLKEGRCSAASGACEADPLPDGTACDQGTCAAGVCVAPEPPSQGCGVPGSPSASALGLILLGLFLARRRGPANCA